MSDVIHAHAQAVLDQATSDLRLLMADIDALVAENNQLRVLVHDLWSLPITNRTTEMRNRVDAYPISPEQLELPGVKWDDFRC